MAGGETGEASQILQTVLGQRKQRFEDNRELEDPLPRGGRIHGCRPEVTAHPDDSICDWQHLFYARRLHYGELTLSRCNT